MLSTQLIAAKLCRGHAKITPRSSRSRANHAFHDQSILGRRHEGADVGAEARCLSSRLADNFHEESDYCYSVPGVQMELEDP